MFIPGVTKRALYISCVVAACVMVYCLIIAIIRHVDETQNPSLKYRAEPKTDISLPAIAVCPFAYEQGDRVYRFSDAKQKYNYTGTYELIDGHMFGMVAKNPRELAFETDYDKFKYASVSFNRTIGQYSGCVVYNEDLKVKFTGTSNIMFMYILHSFWSGDLPNPFPLLLIGSSYGHNVYQGGQENRVFYDSHFVNFNEFDTLDPTSPLTVNSNGLVGIELGKTIKLNGDVDDQFSLSVTSLPSYIDAIFIKENATWYDSPAFQQYVQWYDICKANHLGMTTVSVTVPNFVISINEEYIGYTVSDIIGYLGGIWSILGLYFDKAFPDVEESKRKLRFTQYSDDKSVDMYLNTNPSKSRDIGGDASQVLADEMDDMEKAKAV